MPAERAPMRKVREVLRLRHALGVSERQIAVTTGLSRSTVSEYSTPRQGRSGAPIQTQFQRRIAELLRQWPDQAGPPCPPHAFAHRRHADRQAGCNLAFGHAAGTQPQHVAYLAHG